jgi:hypothetical protein
MTNKWQYHDPNLSGLAPESTLAAKVYFFETTAKLKVGVGGGSGGGRRNQHFGFLYM